MSKRVRAGGYIQCPECGDWLKPDDDGRPPCHSRRVKSGKRFVVRGQVCFGTPVDKRREASQK